MSNLLFSEGLYVLMALGVLLSIGLCKWQPLVYVVVPLFVFSLYFFRNPIHSCPVQAGVIVAPADGTVIAVSTDQRELDGYAQRLSIFLSVWDVHVQWAPLAGVIKRTQYRRGTFSLAYLPKSSVYNERNDMVIKGDDGSTVMVRQIAGTIARRISCWVHEGQQVARCQKIGMIRFGSRVDLFLPPHATLTARIGDRVKGGETIVAHFKSIDSQI